MLSQNQILRNSFENLWRQKLEKSQYNLEESTLDSFSPRQCRLGDYLVFYNLKKVKPKLVFGEKIKTEPEVVKEKIIGKVVNKPSYRDEFFKIRPGDGYLILELSNGNNFYASVKNVFAKV